MKTKITILCLLIAMNFASKAQNYVTIPDINFVAYLQATFPSCMNGNLMDTTCIAIQNDTSIAISGFNIYDLTGIQYFSSLQVLNCDLSSLTNLSILPGSLLYLNCMGNDLTSLPPLPNSLKVLICASNQLTSLPSLPNSLQKIECDYNPLGSLPTLPNSLQTLICSANNLTSLPILPDSLTKLFCGYNQLTSLPLLPNSLQTLYCEYNQLTSLPLLTNSLQKITCYHNQLTSLPLLPASLKQLWCQDNQLTSLPLLPDSLQELDCAYNQLTSLPVLSANLKTLVCNFNSLVSLPALPNFLSNLTCSQNQLISLPSLPASLKQLWCGGNQLTSLPVLPDSLWGFGCNNNNISCFPTFPNTLIDSGSYGIYGNPFTCLPNYIPAMDFATLAYPLCVTGDTINNIYGCAGSQGIAGYAYKDNNANCIKDSSDLRLINIPLKLYDINNNLLYQTYSAINGIYNFSDSIGSYTVKIDTAGQPFTAQCTYPGLDSTVTLTYSNPLQENVNFSLKCKSGFDIGVQSVFSSGWVFPGHQHRLSIVAGDMNQWYNLNCVSGISGQVQVTVTGPITYNGISSGTLTPSVTGNVFTYTIADFATINNTQDFGLLFTTDTSAQAGDQICVNVTVTPTNGDNNITNNTYQFCYQVINSYDPNLKEVYPVNVLPGYNDWLTYTIHFQNTGTAPAMNIRLVDTLSNNLDLETFQLINYSHQNTVSLQNKVLTFRFPNTQLPDSSSNSEGSKGFVQYRIKPKPNLPLGTQIQNTANIYFDYNAPIVTNTTINEYTQTASIKEIETNASLSVYPNPGNGKYKIQIDNGQLSMDNYQLSIINVLGEKIYQSEIKNPKSEIDISKQPNGIYIVRVQGNIQSFSQRLVKQ